MGGINSVVAKAVFRNSLYLLFHKVRLMEGSGGIMFLKKITPPEARGQVQWGANYGINIIFLTGIVIAKDIASMDICSCL